MRKYGPVWFILVLSFCYSSAQVMNVRKWRKGEKDSLDNGMYLIEENQYLDALPIFDELLQHHPNEEFLRYTYAKCALYRGDKHQDAYTYLTELYDRNKKVADIQYDVALASLYNYKFDEATDYINTFLKNRRLTTEQQLNARMVLKYIANARYFYNKPTGAKLYNLGPAINSSQEETMPSITADESKLVYTYVGTKSSGGIQNEYFQPDPLGKYKEDVFIAYRDGINFRPARPVESINTNLPESALSLSGDGSAMFLFQDLGDSHGDLFISMQDGETYSRPQKLVGEVNSYSWDGYCSLSPDGKTLYFSSDRPGGFGGRDIYRATLLADSVWGNVVNLGDSINTQYDEDSPFIHPDGLTLYFSSTGHSSMGGYDIFRSQMQLPDSSFKSSVNLGYPINTTTDDRYFVVAADSKHAYFSSYRREGFGQSDIYMIEPNFQETLPALYLVKGRITDNGSPVAANIRITESSRNGREFRQLKSNASSGQYMFSLPQGAQYHIALSFAGKSRDFDIDATSITGYNEKVYNADLSLAEEPIATASVSSTPSLAAATKTTGAISPDITAKASKNTETLTAKAPPVSPTPTVAATKTVASLPKDSAIALAPTVAISNTLAPPANTVASAGKTLAVAREAGFPKTPMQEKTMRYVEMYGQQTAPELEFRVQVAAVKSTNASVLPNQKALGKVDRIDLGDGFIRITVGGAFPTIAEAFEQNRKVVRAGLPEGFVIALYKGKRVSYNYLEEIGVFK